METRAWFLAAARRRVTPPKESYQQQQPRMIFIPDQQTYRYRFPQQLGE